MEANTAEDIIWILCVVTVVGGALFIGQKFQDSLGIKIFKILMYPLSMIANILDGNWWAEKIGKKTGLYDKAEENALAKWSRELAGWHWWTYQIGIASVVVILIEIVLNMLGFSILPWRW
jgi:hypothetical protein